MDLQNLSDEVCLEGQINSTWSDQADDISDKNIENTASQCAIKNNVNLNSAANNTMNASVEVFSDGMNESTVEHDNDGKSFIPVTYVKNQKGALEATSP